MIIPIILPFSIFLNPSGIYLARVKKKIIIITDLYSAFRSEDTEALDAAQKD